MHNPVRYQCGQQVCITKENWQTIRDASRSVNSYPDDEYVNIVYKLMKDQTPGTITQLFLPGYEFNVTFSNDLILQMKDNWVTPLPEYDPVESFA
jgi:hypothetical protein